MKENELRIGNYVFSADDNKNGEVFQIDPSGIIFVNKNGNRWQDLKNIQPIPLTEEILLKCGFIIDSINNFEKYPFTIQKNNLYVADFLFYKKGDSGVVIKHLHQLQNLYFALTGKELEINL